MYVQNVICRVTADIVKIVWFQHRTVLQRSLFAEQYKMLQNFTVAELHQ